MIDADFNLVRGTTNIHFLMKDGGMILLSGNNGTGKTSSLLCMAGILQEQSGTCIVNSGNIFNLPAGKRSVVYINTGSTFNSMIVRDHLEMAAQDGERVKEIMNEFSLDGDTKVGNLSQGNRMRVSVATAILSNPSLLLLDEIISTISDPAKFLELLKSSIQKYNFDTIFVTQNESLTRYCDHHYIMRDGGTEKSF